VILLRSIVFNIAFYLNVLVWLAIALPTFLMPYRAIVAVAKAWGRSNLLLLRVICGLKADFRGIEKIPRGAALVAAKHQSAWETFALLWLFDNPTFILKRELQWLPFFGWFTIKGRMIPVDRGARSEGLKAMAARVLKELAAGRQIVIFPEGTRRPAGAEPQYKYGIVRLYTEGNVPCVPIALNSGLFWKRRSIIRVPGTVLVEVLDPIPSGLDSDAFMARLQNDIETATARLIDEGRHDLAGRGLSA
jgi:1-acyl-sn-glycerol-3-phosphate acyltransferase